MYQDAKYIIRIGSSPMTSAQLLMGLWSRVQTLHPDIKFQIVPFENTPENEREILANLGKNTDVVGGIFDETMLHLRGCAGLELTRGPFHCAVFIHHRLAAKDKLQIADLYGENLLLMHRGWSHYVDQLRDDGSDKARSAYENLHAAHENAGWSEADIDRFLRQEIPDNAFFNQQGIYNYHGGANVVFDDPDNLNWVISHSKG